MLTSFSLQNFKSFSHRATLPLRGPLTVLIGANAAGKSNLLEALRLLSWLAQGNKLGTIQNAINQGDQVIRGRVPDIFQRGQTRLELGCEVDGVPDEARSLHMALELRDDDLHIVAERIGPEQGVPLYEMDQPAQVQGTQARVAYNNFARGGKKPHIPVSDQTAVFSQLLSPASFQASHKKAQDIIPEICGQYKLILADALFLDPIPARMRGYGFLADKKLLGDGSNLSSVLYSLCKVHLEPENERVRRLLTALDMPKLQQSRRDILDFVKDLPEQNIDSLDFLQGPRNDVMLQLVESFGGQPRAYEAALLSDGTLRVLAIAAAMLSAPEGSLVVIEEIDNGVHPSRARHLLERIQSVAERRHLRVLLSTHNPAMLDALPDSAVPDVVFCYRDPQEGDSRLVRLGDLPDAPELLVQDTLGHLLTSGAVDRFVKTYEGPQARKDKALAWLEALRASDAGAAS